jgi:DNA-binding beta-propeller fold protein YncE
MGSDNSVPLVRTSADVSAKIPVLLGALLALLASGGCGGGSTNANGGGGGPVAAEVSGTIAVGTTPNAIAVDSTTNKIYVADFGEEDNNGICQTCYCPVVNGTLTVIDGATQSPTTTGFSYAYSNPLDLAVNVANHTLYVASRVFFTVSPTCGFSDNVAALAGATLAQTATTYVGSAHEGAQIAVNQNAGNVFVTDWYDGTVTVLDGGGNLLAKITLQTRPTGVAVNASTNKIYVSDGSEINVIDGSTNSVVGTIAVAANVVAVNPATNTIYAVESGNIAVIDGTTGLVTATVSAPSPTALAVDTQTNFIYVANAGNYDSNQHGSVTVINGATNVTTTTLTDSNMPYPFRIAVNSTTNKIYVASIVSNSVTIIDGAHN